MRKYSTILFCLSVFCAGIAAQAQTRQHYDSIKPGQVWLDTSGKPIQAHGFQIFEQDGTYYWYGENKEHTLRGSNVWTWGIRAYKSTDFYNWEDLGLIIPPDEENPLSPLHYSQSLDRPHILYCSNTGKWVCWIKSMATDGYFVVLQADRFEGPYTLIRSFKPEGFGVGDFDMYVDPDTGHGYVWFERPHWEMICAELTDDFLGTNGTFSEHFVGLRPPYTREAPAHFVRDGKHYMFTSGTSGYTPNPSKVAVFTDYHGEYTDLGCPHIDDAWQDSFCSQISGVVKIPGRDLYIALADRWLPHIAGTDVAMRTWKSYETRYVNHQPNERDFSEPQVRDKSGSRRGGSDTTVGSTYVFLPVTFDADGKPTLVWQDEWRLEDYQIPTRLEVGPAVMPAEIEPIEGVTLDAGLYWNVVPQYCENVVIRGVTVRSHGHGRTDGVDVESSRNVLVEYCSLDCQDDNYTLKSGRGVDGVRVGIPTENVVIRKSLALRGGGGRPGLPLRRTGQGIRHGGGDRHTEGALHPGLPHGLYQRCTHRALRPLPELRLHPGTALPRRPVPQCES